MHMKIFLKGQEYKIVQKYFRLCTFCGFYVHKIHKKCTIWNIFGQSYIPDPLTYVICTAECVVLTSQNRMLIHNQNDVLYVLKLLILITCGWAIQFYNGNVDIWPLQNGSVLQKGKFGRMTCLKSIHENWFLYTG